MKRVKVLFINFLLYSTSGAKPFTASNIDSEDTSHVIKVAPAGLEKDKESITIYGKNDDVLSISEFRKNYNPEEQHFRDFRFIRETDNAYIKKVTSKDNKTTLDGPKIQEYNEEDRTEIHADSTTVKYIEESKITTETNDIESTTISIKDQDISISVDEEFIEDDLEVPVSGESTEGYMDIDIDISIEDTDSDKLDTTVPIMPSRRSFNDQLLLDNSGRTTNKPVEVSEVNRDVVPKSGIMDIKEPNKQSKIESKTETTSATPQLVPMHPYRVIDSQQSPNLFPDLSFRRTGSVDLKQISNHKNANIKLVEKAPKDKESNNLDKSRDVLTNENSTDFYNIDFNDNVYENEYPYTSLVVEKKHQQSLTREGNLNSLYSKLSDASNHPFRNNQRTSGKKIGNNAVIVPNFNLPSRRFYNIGTYNLGPLSRRLISCRMCGRN